SEDDLTIRRRAFAARNGDQHGGHHRIPLASFQGGYEIVPWTAFETALRCQPFAKGASQFHIKTRKRAILLEVERRVVALRQNDEAKWLGARRFRHRDQSFWVRKGQAERHQLFNRERRDRRRCRRILQSFGRR